MTYYAVVTSPYLSHFGIKGMKWGVRHDRERVGRRRRFRTNGGSSGNRSQSLHERYVARTSANFQKQYGMSKKEADAEAEKRAKILRRAAIAGTLAVGTAATVALVKKYRMENVDQIIKGGAQLQTLSDRADRMTNSTGFYTAYNRGDKMTYAGLFGKNANGTNKNKITADVKDNIKVASPKNAKKIFEELKSNDKDFSEAYKQLKPQIDAVEGGNSKKNEYELFNTYAPLLKGGLGDTLQNKFYDGLKKQGYGGVADVNDQKYSGFSTKAAIIFDNKNLSNIKVNTLSDNEVAKGMIYHGQKKALQSLTKPTTLAMATAAGAALAVDAQNIRLETQSKAKKEEKDKKNKKTA